MSVEHVNAVGPEALQLRLHHCLDVIGPAVQTPRSRASLQLDVETELGRDYRLLSERLDGFAEQGLVGKGAVGFRGVEQRHSAVEGGANHRDPFIMRRCGAVGRGKAHAALAQGGGLQTYLAELTLFHGVFSLRWTHQALSGRHFDCAGRLAGLTMPFK